MTDPIDLARRLRDLAAADRPPICKDCVAHGAAADLIERQYAEIERLRAVEQAAQSYIERGRKENGPYWLPHLYRCADLSHEHTGSRYDAAGVYVGGFVADHACPPCDCGAATIVAALREKGAEK